MVVSSYHGSPKSMGYTNEWYPGPCIKPMLQLLYIYYIHTYIYIHIYIHTYRSSYHKISQHHFFKNWIYHMTLERTTQSWVLWASRANCQGSTLPFFEKRRTWRHGISYSGTFCRKMWLSNVEWWKIWENSQKIPSEPHQSDRVRKKIRFQVHHLGFSVLSWVSGGTGPKSSCEQPTSVGPNLNGVPGIRSGQIASPRFKGHFQSHLGKQSLVLNEVSW